MLHVAKNRIEPRLMAMAAVLAVSALVLAFFTGCSDSTAVKNSVNDYSWSELSEISDQISEASNDAEGLEIAKKYHLLNGSGKLDGSQTKKVTLADGTQTTVIVAGFRADTAGDGSKAGITFIFGDAVEAHGMNEAATNSGGWESSEMRTWLNGDFTSQLPSDLKSALVSVSKKTNTGADSSPGSISSTSDKLWLPSVVEVSGSVSASNMPAHGKYSADSFNAEGSQYELFKDTGITVNDDNDELVRTCIVDTDSGIVKKGEDCQWWLRSLSMDWNAGFEAVDAAGNPYTSWMPDYELGVVPGFCV